jgi:proline iminopeptidase
MRLLVLLALACACLCTCLCAGAQPEDAYARARAIVADLDRITAPAGVQASYKTAIGGGAHGSMDAQGTGAL